jgi:hypothetical protein
MFFQVLSLTWTSYITKGKEMDRSSLGCNFKFKPVIIVRSIYSTKIYCTPLKYLSWFSC